MIKITYEHICDICEALLDTEVYKCSSHPHLPYPKPHGKHTFNLPPFNADLCWDCAEPMYKAKDEVMDKLRAKRIQEHENENNPVV